MVTAFLQIFFRHTVRLVRVLTLCGRRKRYHEKAAIMTVLVATGILMLVLASVQQSPAEDNVEGPYYGYRCDDRICFKERITSANKKQLVAQSVCKQQCGAHGNLWPHPNGVNAIGPNLTALDIWSIAVSDDIASYKTLNSAFELFRTKQRAKVMNPDGSSLFATTGSRLLVVFNVTNPGDTSFDLSTDESYELKIDSSEPSTVRATITSKTYYGARHALETLHQLIIVDDLRREVRIPDFALIKDRPSYPYRGIVIDTARSFVTIETLKRSIDAMGASKLNTFHWHITDSQSFPFESKLYPLLTKLGAYSDKHIYTQSEISELVEYAKIRGVRVIPELDAPAHVGEGWQFAPGTITCFKANPWRNFCVEPPCGQFDPTNEQVYEIIGAVYQEMLRTFQPPVFHMGGDEVHFGCWNTSKTILQWLSARNLSNAIPESFHELWEHFQTKAYDKLVAANGGKEMPVILWTSGLTGAKEVENYLDPKKYIIQIWTQKNDPVIRDLANKKYRLIFSNYDALYLDCGFGAWVGTGNNWCSPYIGWQKVYDNDPRSLLKDLGISDADSQALALGAEAALWTEQADSNSINSKIWPRAAAMAERLWSDPVSDWKAAESRFLEHRERLAKLGVTPDAIEPQWCVQNEGFCY